jgi:hypothetical protein
VARLLGVTVEDTEVEYEQIGDVLHTYDASVDLRYVSNFAEADDGFTFPDDFSEALSNLLAAELAMSVTQTQALRDTYLNMYAERLGQARFNGAIERRDTPVTASSWVEAHEGFPQEMDPTLRGLAGF